MPTNLQEPKTTPVTPRHTTALAAQTRENRLLHRLFDTTAALCAASGYRRIALCGNLVDVSPVVRQPWLWHNIEVVAVVSPTITSPTVRGVPVVPVSELPPKIDSVVICTEWSEHNAYEHVATLRARGMPILRVHHEQPTWEEPPVAVQRLTQHWGVPADEARWLIENRGERHDATLPMLLPRRTELHLRRYEFASAYTQGLRVADIACGTGYGSRVLMSQGAAVSVSGVDVDAQTVAYAQRRFATDGVSFRVADGVSSGLAPASVDVVTSFETIEHVPDARAFLAEFARILTPASQSNGRGGKVVLSTPNDWGLSDHHVHSFTPGTLCELLNERFTINGVWSQLDSSTPREGTSGLPEGIAPMLNFDEPADTVLVVATVRP